MRAEAEASALFVITDVKYVNFLQLMAIFTHVALAHVRKM